jgi:hypothetical protein
MVYNGTTTAVVNGSASLLAAETAGTGSTGDGTPYSGDTVSMTGTPTGAYNNKNVASATTVTYGGLTLSGAQASDYSLTPLTQAATITPVTLTVEGSFTAGNRTYDGTTAATIISNSLSLIGILNTDSVTFNPVAAFLGASVGVGKTVNLTGRSSLSGSASSDYDLSLTGAPTATANITPATALPNTVVWTSQSVSQPNWNTTTDTGNVVLAPSGTGTFIPAIGGTIFAPPSQTTPDSNPDQTGTSDSVSNAAFNPSPEEMLFNLPSPNPYNSNAQLW